MNLTTDYQNLLEDLCTRIREAQYAAQKAVNKEMLVLYWHTGTQILHKQKELGSGKSVVEQERAFYILMAKKMAGQKTSSFIKATI